MKQETPVTFVIPLYNQLKFIPECLQSIINQTFTDWKSIVVDDQTPDGDAQAVIDSLNDPRIVLVRHSSNKGLAAARNTGFRMARSPWIVPVDADDKLDSHFLKAMFETVQKNLQTNVVVPDFYIFGTAEGIQTYPLKDERASLIKQSIPGPGCFISRRLWEEAGGYCEHEVICHGNEDWEFWISAMEIGIKATLLHKPLYFYRRHETSMMTRQVFYEHITRPFIYKKHKKTFKRYHAGRKFLFDGYYLSAVSYSRKKQKLMAASIGLKALSCSPDWKSFKKTIRFFIGIVNQ